MLGGMLNMSEEQLAFLAGSVAGGIVSRSDLDISDRQVAKFALGIARQIVQQINEPAEHAGGAAG